MTDLLRQWHRWRMLIHRRVDTTGMTFLAVCVITIIIFSIRLDSLIVCLLLMLPITLLASYGGWGAGLLGGIVATVLTAPYFGEHTSLISPPISTELWISLSLCYLFFGALIGFQGASMRQSRQMLYSEIEAKLENAKASAERYEALLEEMSEGQEFLQRMNEELAILNTIATAVNSSLEVTQVQMTAMTNIATLMHVDEVQIYWIDQESSTFILQAAYPHTVDVAQVPPVSMKEGLLGRVVHSQRAESISDVAHTLGLRPPAIDVMAKSIIAIPLRSRSRLFGALVLGRRSGRAFTDDDEKFLASVGRVMAVAIENAKLFKQTQEMSLVDELTGLANRRMFNMHLANEINHAQVTNGTLGLVFFDLDHFKWVNDQYGHLVGDQALRQFAQSVQQCIRGSDLLCRYGGEEFALIVPDLGLPEATALADRILHRIAATPFRQENGAAFTLTVSAGVSCLGNEITTAEEMIDAADRALYLAKASGRNQVRWANYESDPPMLETHT